MKTPIGFIGNLVTSSGVIRLISADEHNRNDAKLDMLLNDLKLTVSTRLTIANRYIMKYDNKTDWKKISRIFSNSNVKVNIKGKEDFCAVSSYIEKNDDATLEDLQRLTSCVVEKIYLLSEIDDAKLSISKNVILFMKAITLSVGTNIEYEVYLNNVSPILFKINPYDLSMNEENRDAKYEIVWSKLLINIEYSKICNIKSIPKSYAECISVPVKDDFIYKKNPVKCKKEYVADDDIILHDEEIIGVHKKFIQKAGIHDGNIEPMEGNNLGKLLAGIKINQ